MMNGKNTNVIETLNLIPLNSIGVELGVWKGDSSQKFLTRARFLYLVDSWSVISYKNSEEHGNYNGYLKRYKKIVGSDNPSDFQKYYDSIYKEVLEKFKDSPVKIYRMSTKEWFNIFNNKVDWIYVDANHGYTDALFDLRESFKIIKSGGLLFADDYSKSKPGVKRAVEDFSKEKELLFNNFYNNQVYFEIP